MDVEALDDRLGSQRPDDVDMAIAKEKIGSGVTVAREGFTEQNHE